VSETAAVDEAADERLRAIVDNQQRVWDAMQRLRDHHGFPLPHESIMLIARTFNQPDAVWLFSRTLSVGHDLTLAKAVRQISPARVDDDEPPTLAELQHAIIFAAS
jgi:hypothetical protein